MSLFFNKYLTWKETNVTHVFMSHIDALSPFKLLWIIDLRATTHVTNTLSILSTTYQHCQSFLMPYRRTYIYHTKPMHFPFYDVLNF